MTKKGSHRRHRVWDLAGIVTGGASAIALVAPFQATIGKLATGTTSDIMNQAATDAKAYWTNLSVGGVVAPLAVYAAGKALVGRQHITRDVVVF